MTQKKGSTGRAPTITPLLVPVKCNESADADIPSGSDDSEGALLDLYGD